ncbi:hypothetical protein AG1IA_08793 [Rhizoctonia solani AG-1 IA]|uniref:Uncharacterized protein n=1 Tax=Thanatephorus cucumeris (strain AG1-IA) TaxID=983506 RepID=L8WKA1_THACA|nr:hypothetical protein AG1IA_08793 [Rhizoctonia solani AG-1 IA]
MDSSTSTSHPFAGSSGLIQVIPSTIHDLIEEEARLWDEFPADNRVDMSGRVSPPGSMANHSVFSNDIWLGDNCGNADRTFARDVQLVGWASVGDSISTGYVGPFDTHYLLMSSTTFQLSHPRTRLVSQPYAVASPFSPLARVAKYRPAFLDSRRRKLQTWLATVLMHPDIGGCSTVQRTIRTALTRISVSAQYRGSTVWAFNLTSDTTRPINSAGGQYDEAHCPSAFEPTCLLFLRSLLGSQLLVASQPSPKTLPPWRLASKASRTTTMIRPAIFVLVRTATYIMRAVQSNGDYSETLFIVEQVFLLAGFPIICDAILTLLEYHITRTHTSPKQGQTTQRVCRLLRLALLVSCCFWYVSDPL